MVRGAINPDYHMPNRPHFDTVEMKGGGDAVSAARAVIQTGEYDFAWNIQVEDEILLRLEKGGKGKTLYAVGGDIEFIAINFTDPNTEVDGERSSMKTKHPLLSDPAVRKALSFLVDRNAVQKVIYGRAGRTTANYLNGPAQFVSKNTSWEFSIEKATKLLDEAGWKPGADGIREKAGKKLKLLYQTSINGPRQKTQAIVKQACQKAGIEVELKSVVASVFFSSDVANPDTYSKFYADIEEFQIPMTQPDPALHMRRYISRNVATKAEQVAGSEFPALGQQGFRCGDRRGGSRNRSGQAGSALHQVQRHVVARHRLHSRDAPPQGRSLHQLAAPRVQRLGQRNRQYPGLVSGGVRTIAGGLIPHEPVRPASPPDRHSEPARHFARSIHRARACAR